VPRLVVAVAVLFNYWFLRAEAIPVAYLDDSSVHEQMVRFAASRISSGHLPQTSWFPYLGLGSPQSLHYQSLPSTLTGLVGIAIGPNRAFAWSLYLLLSLWPISVYVGARAFRLRRWEAAAAAVLSVFVVSVIGIGYETGAYVWTGFGVWTQLWAMWTLPLAWGFTWQAIGEGRRYFPAVAFVSLTVMFHFETGYLALMPIVLFPLLDWSHFWERVKRAVVVGIGVVAAAAWAVVPLLVFSKWAAVNEVLRGTALENGYGARLVLGWLMKGELLDSGRIPVVTIFAGIGLVVCVARFRRVESSRALIVLLVMSLVLSFGRTTFGSLVGIMPGSTDIFMRRFMMGIQLAALFFAGVGVVAAGSLLVRGSRIAMPSLSIFRASHSWVRIGTAGAAVVLAVVLLAPAWSQLKSEDERNASAIAYQKAADTEQGRRIAPLIQWIKRAGDGRAYAGLPTNWGASFTVGAVPVFKYLESQDVDEVGYTLRTASLMTDPEYYFDESNPGDYALFGVRYVIEPSNERPAVPARLVMERSPYALWELPSVGYLRVAEVVGSLVADRADVGLRSVGYLRSSLPERGETLNVDYSGSTSGGSSSPPAPARSSPVIAAGVVLSQSARLDEGTARALVRMSGSGVVVLSASFDPGWQVTVDGRKAAPVMLAPALVGVHLGPGTHLVVFTYAGFDYYPLLMIVSGLVLLAFFLYDCRRLIR